MCARPFAVILAVAAFSPALAPAQVIYTVADLGSLGGSSGGQAVNSSGQVTGTAHFPDLPNGERGPKSAPATKPAKTGADE